MTDFVYFSLFFSCIKVVSLPTGEDTVSVHTTNSCSASLFITASLSHQSMSDSTCAGVHGRAAAEILTPHHTAVRHNPAMDREELRETDAGRGKEGA